MFVFSFLFKEQVTDESIIFHPLIPLAVSFSLSSELHDLIFLFMKFLSFIVSFAKQTNKPIENFFEFLQTEATNELDFTEILNQFECSPFYPYVEEIIASITQ